jgi:3-hydroxyisobutyrate dehydrogenase
MLARMKHIAFLGLGRMGTAMASRLLARGYELTVYNRTASRAESLVDAGAALAPTPRDACAGADAVVAMTAVDVSSRAMWLGDDGALAAEVAPRAFAIGARRCRTSGPWRWDAASSSAGCGTSIRR